MKLCFDDVTVYCLTICFTVRASSIHVMHCGPVLELLIELVAVCFGHKRACLKCVLQKEQRQCIGRALQSVQMNALVHTQQS